MLSRKLRCCDQRFTFCNLITAFIIRLHSFAKCLGPIHIARSHHSEKILPPEILMFCKHFSKPLESAIGIAFLVCHRNREPLA